MLRACLTAALLVLGGCVAGVGGDAPRTESRFDYEPTAHENDTGLTLAVLRPTVLSPDDTLAEPAQPLAPFQERALNYRADALAQLSIDGDQGLRFQAEYERRHEQPMMDALAHNIGDVLTSYGFRNGGLYDSYQAVGAEARQNLLLLAVPQATIAVTDEIESQDCDDRICRQTGSIEIDGQFLFQLVEPITGATVGISRMNLYGFQSRESYTAERLRAPDTWFGRIAAWFMPTPETVDTSDQALARVMENFYAEAMGRIDTLVSRPRILALNDRIEDLKHSERSPR